MKRLVNILILVYIIATLLMIMTHPVMHKPVALEHIRFKLKDQILKPQTRVVSDFEFKFKFHRARPIVAKTEEKEIEIPLDEDEKQLAFQFDDSSTTYQDTTFEFEDNVSSREQDMEVDVSATEDKYSEQSIDTSTTDVKQHESLLDLYYQGPQLQDKYIELADQDIPETDVYLEDKDEVGNRKFKASREEVIAWNIWRSNLQNEIMMRSAVEAPVGTLITFAFDVSENGKISNLKYSCSSPKYADAARKDMVVVLREIEGTDVLIFPENTKRKNVKFKGAFMLDYSTSFSKPSDYSDYERVMY